jgi:hypothetical protein
VVSQDLGDPGQDQTSADEKRCPHGIAKDIPAAHSRYLHLRSELYGSRPVERLRQPGEHHKVGVKLYALQAAHSERRKPVVVLESSELALNCLFPFRATQTGKWRQLRSVVEREFEPRETLS